jgi:hypothetical protein
MLLLPKTLDLAVLLIPVCGQHGQCVSWLPALC